MLVKLEMVEWEHAYVFIKQFRKFDVINNGRLTQEDIQQGMEKERLQLMHRTKSLKVDLTKKIPASRVHAVRVTDKHVPAARVADLASAAEAPAEDLVGASSSRPPA